jgi:hypothetical protein
MAIEKYGLMRGIFEDRISDNLSSDVCDHINFEHHRNILEAGPRNLLLPRGAVWDTIHLFGDMNIARRGQLGSWWW